MERVYIFKQELGAGRHLSIPLSDSQVLVMLSADITQALSLPYRPPSQQPPVCPCLMYHSEARVKIKLLFLKGESEGSAHEFQILPLRMRLLPHGGSEGLIWSSIAFELREVLVCNLGEICCEKFQPFVKHINWVIVWLVSVQRHVGMKGCIILCLVCGEIHTSDVTMEY